MSGGGELAGVRIINSFSASFVPREKKEEVDSPHLLIFDVVLRKRARQKETAERGVLEKASSNCP